MSVNRVIGCFISFMFLLEINCTNNASTAPDLAIPSTDLSRPDEDLSIGLGDMSQVPGDMSQASVQPKICSPDYWCWENPLPQGYGFRGVWAADANNVWTPTATKRLLKWNGTAWVSNFPSPTDATMAVWGTSSDNLWAVGQNGMIAKWNGTVWTAQTSGTTQALFSVWGADASNVWAVGQSGTIVKGDYDPPIRTYTDLRMEMSGTLPTSPT